MSEQKPSSIAVKKCEIMAAVKRVAKRGRNEFHNYAYATESDVLDIVRDEMASRGLVLQPQVVSASVRGVGGKGRSVTELEMTMTWQDSETGETEVCQWTGWGVDAEDKGGYKAMTGAEKYFLMKTFLIPTGDDPEHTEAPETQPESHEDPAPRASSTGVTVVDVSRNLVGKNKDIEQFRVTFSDSAITYSTLKSDLGQLAEELMNSGASCAYTTEQKGKYTNLVSLERLEEQAGDEGQDELTADEIPF